MVSRAAIQCGLAADREGMRAALNASLVGRLAALEAAALAVRP